MKIFFLVPFLCLLVSCEKEIKLDGDEVAPRIVVNCIFGDGDTILVHVSESRSILFEGQLPNLTNATCKLYDDNKNLLGDFTHQGDGYYKLNNYSPIAGLTYHIEVSNTGFETVTAQTETPTVISINSIDTIRKPDEMNYKISFLDNGSFKNYYAISLQTITFYEDEFTGEIYPQYDEYFETSEIFTQNGSADVDGSKYGNIFLFSDASFNGGQCTFNAKKYLFGESQDSMLVVVSLLSLSEDYFKYKLSLERYYEADGDPFAQPVQVYSNIDKGFGIFGAYSFYRDTIFFQ